mmetsp:Transcript_7929/g.13146  ORF Transcript_7929/g.13146 Transcript_7929/m.13146 type:complete len:237 (+) Transcript_7929:88-798(+)|eukprot:CAMPEP_0174969254 /NCGR_PEP_ID=MMETSP0004_2-20121128/8643_1 /TAXON_ID=420556 /ORGANISM="Ochromonas sp., Strain CCMP1393" /LENGTH=236 /DNA_ID=CAMNT_0016218689 /DNA_START=206 /DNA_END=916 /DNA_ORIENTATION=+
MSGFTTEIAEVESLLNSATFPGVQNVLKSHLNKLKIAEAEKAQRKEMKEGVSADAVDNVAEMKIPVVPATAVSKAVYIPIEDFAWDQGQYNSPIVSIFVDLDSVGTVKDNVKVDFTPTSFDLKVHDLQGKNYRLLRDNLEKDIIPEQSKFIVKSNKLVIKLQKVKGEYSYEHWPSLIAKKKRSEQSAKKADPMGGIMDMMKDMYEDGDENMKKVIGEAMLKSQRGEKPEPPNSNDF